MAKKPEHKQQKQYYNKFNKDFKNDPRQKKKSFKKRKKKVIKGSNLSFEGFFFGNSFIEILVLYTIYPLRV